MGYKSTMLLPQGASTIASEVDALFYIVYYVSIIFSIMIFGGVTYLSIEYRRRGRISLTTSLDSNHKLEVAWTVIPTIIVLILFAMGFRTYMKMNIVPAGAMEIKVSGQMWFWSFDHPSGANSVGELVVPVNKPVKLLISSRDVLHSFYIPEFRIKMDAVPNRYTIIWFEAIDTGSYNIFCTEYCGTGHSTMLGKCRVVTQKQYDEWVELNDIPEDMPLEELGEKLYKSRACNTCHSIDGSTSTGPTFKGIFGHDVALEDGGSVVVDENYIRESILNPQAKIVAGFQPVMPTFEGILKDRHIDAIVAYLKTLAKSPEEDTH